MAASLKDPGSIPGGESKGFHNKLQLCVLHWWGAHFMRGRHSFGHGFDLAVYFFPHEDAPELPVTAGVGLGFWVVHSSHLSEI